jgi:cell volume regulation protein A
VANEREVRAVFGDFSLDADAPIGSICSFYDLPVPAGPERPVGAWLTTALGRPPVVGDDLRVGTATLSVRAMEGPRITAVGLKLEGNASVDDAMPTIDGDGNRPTKRPGPAP